MICPMHFPLKYTPSKESWQSLLKKFIGAMESARDNTMNLSGIKMFGIIISMFFHATRKTGYI